MQKDTFNQLSKTTIVLHWIVGISIILLMAVGMYMSSVEAYDVYPIHKSIGMLILVLIIFRVIWRIQNGWPQPVRQYPPLEQILAKLVHWVLIVGIVLFPISGMIMSHAGGHGLSVFSLELTAMNIDPETAKVVANNKLVAGIAHEIHEILGSVMMVAIILHFVGALKHHIYDMDGTLKRMKGQKID